MGVRNMLSNLRRHRQQKRDNNSTTNITQNRATKRAFRNVALKLPNTKTTKDIRHYDRVTIAIGSRTADRKARMHNKRVRRMRYNNSAIYEPARRQT